MGVYAALFGSGFLLEGRVAPGMACLVLLAAAVAGVFKALPYVGVRG